MGIAEPVSVLDPSWILLSGVHRARLGLGELPPMLAVAERRGAADQPLVGTQRLAGGSGAILSSLP